MILIVSHDAPDGVYFLSPQSENHKIIRFHLDREALEVLATHRPIDIVLMDIMMPEMDGLEATRQIRAMKEYAALPVIALTAKATPADRQAALEAGCTDYVAKPADVRQLHSVIARRIQSSAT